MTGRAIMNHLIVCREFPPAPHPAGGIGTYTSHISELLVNSGETVHVLAQRWEGAPARLEVKRPGRFFVHRVATDDLPPSGHSGSENIPKFLLSSACSAEAFSWVASLAAERLIEEFGIDLVEGPEWEAPLYYLQLRRRVGLGPAARPPCLVHLHSPVALIFKHNDWDTNFSDYQRLRRLESFTVDAAEAVLCPSAYLARQASALFTREDIHVIPYPAIGFGTVDRPEKVWRKDSIVYVGRLELRKGVLEWIRAGVEVARSHPTVDFHFVGADTSLDGGPGTSVRRCLIESIPRDLRSRFRFHDGMRREKLTAFLQQFPVLAVPSRWDNLPYTCIEAMSSGIPVLATATGGMAELLVDGKSGWIAPRPTPADLSHAIRQFLETPCDIRQMMGRNAAEAVRRSCSPEAVGPQHLELRRRVAAASRARSVARQSTAASIAAASTTLSVTTSESLRRSVSRPTIAPAAALQTACPPLWDDVASAIRTQPDLRAVILAHDDVSVSPELVEICGRLFQEHRDVDVIAPFVMDESCHRMDSGPGWTTDWSVDDLESFLCAAVRPEALADSRSVHRPRGSAITYPEVLARREPGPHKLMRKRAQAARKRHSVLTLTQRGSARLTIAWFLEAPLPQKLAWVRRVAGEPRRLAQWIAWHIRAAAGRNF